jgi:hypothetical protein
MNGKLHNLAALPRGRPAGPQSRSGSGGKDKIPTPAED